MPPEVDRRSLVKAFTASLTGTSLEWYDIAVYSEEQLQRDLQVVDRGPHQLGGTYAPRLGTISTRPSATSRSTPAPA
ncbi:hypothetical protein [Pseudonocardia sp. DLS-67]